jgi:hypothetical protein
MMVGRNVHGREEKYRCSSKKSNPTMVGLGSIHECRRPSGKIHEGVHMYEGGKVGRGIQMYKGEEKMYRHTNVRG